MQRHLARLACLLGSLAPVSAAVPSIAPSPGDLSAVVGLEESPLFDVSVGGHDTFVYHGFEPTFNRYGYARNGAAFVRFPIAERQAAVVIRTTHPLAAIDIKPPVVGLEQLDAQTLRLSLDRPRTFLLTATFADLGTRYLVVAAEAPERDVPDPNDPSVRYLRRGVHRFGRAWDPFTGPIRTVYLEPGAVVQATIRTVGKSGLRLCGRGVFAQAVFRHAHDVGPLRAEWMADMMGLHFRDCNDLVVDGPAVVNSPSYQLEVANCQDVQIRHLLCLGLGESNNDGVHLYGRHISLEDSFLAGSDDRICITGLFDRERFPVTRKEQLQSRLGGVDVRDLRIQRVVFWGQKNGADIMLTWNGGRTCRDVIVRDVDSLTPTNKAFVAARHGGSVILQDMLFRNVRLYHSRLVDIEVKEASCWGAGGGAVRDLVFDNVTLPVPPAEVRNQILGHSATSDVRSVLFRNITAGGRPVTSLDQTAIQVNDFVRDVTFSAAPKPRRR